MSQQSAVPSPSMMAQFKKPVIANVNPADSAKTYDVNDVHVVKAKHLKPGMEVQPFVHGQPRGTVRVVETVSRVDEEGAIWRVEFSTPHPAQTLKAAYRFWQLNLDEPEAVAEPANPVKRRERPTPAEHLTHTPFAGLASLLKETQG